MSVSRIAAWQEVVDWGGDGLNYTPPGGNRRCSVLFVGAEENNTGGAGIGITSMTLGGSSMVEQREAIVGASSAYHNYNAIWTLNEAGIAAMSGNTLTPTWEQGDGIGPFGEVGNHSAFILYATFQDVDQANIKSAEGGNTNTSATSLSLSATMNVAADELVIVSNVSGQHYALGTSAGGLVEQIEQVGITNDMSIAAYERTALTADAAYDCTMTVATATRMNIQAIALGFDDGGGGGLSIPVAMASYRRRFGISGD